MQVKKQQLEPDMEQWTGSKFGTVCCHPVYLTSVQSTSCEMPGWMNHELESILLAENTNSLTYADDITLVTESEEELKSFLMRVKEESGKAGLKLNIQKN